MRSRNSDAFLDELAAFPNGSHDDCVDALVGAHDALAYRPGNLKSSVPRGNVYGIPDCAGGRGGRSPRRSAAIVAQQIEREHDQAARIAAQIGIPLYDSRRASF